MSLITGGKTIFSKPNNLSFYLLFFRLYRIPDTVFPVTNAIVRKENILFFLLFSSLFFPVLLLQSMKLKNLAGTANSIVFVVKNVQLCDIPPLV